MEILAPTLQGFLWVIAMGVTIVIADAFFETEILSTGAQLGISAYFSLLFDIEWKWRVLICLGCWLVVTALFYTVWKRFVTPLIRRGFTSGIKESIHSAVGSIGEYRSIEGKAFVYWNGDLWPVAPAKVHENFKKNDKVRILASDNGIFTITELNTDDTEPVP